MSTDIEDLKDIMALAIEAVDCSSVVMRNGGLDLSDFGAIWSVIEKIGPAFMGAGTVPEELRDLTPEEIDELVEFVMAELDTPESVSKVVVEKVLKAVKANYEVYLAIRQE